MDTNELKNQIAEYINDIVNKESSKSFEDGVAYGKRISEDKWFLSVWDDEPDIGNKYIVSVCDSHGDNTFDYTDVGVYVGDGAWVLNNEYHTDVIAWKELPYPWKKENV